jgi:phage gpG-like protein
MKEMANLNDIQPLLQQRLQKAVTTLPDVLGNEAVIWIKQNFRRQGYPGESFQAWKPRKANARRNKGRGILIDSSRLSRSPRKMRVGPLRVDVGTDVPYAKAHNDGVDQMVTVRSHQRNKIGNIKVSTGKSGQPFKNKKGITGTSNVRSHQRHMRLPQRRFIGASPVLASILRRKAIIHLAKNTKA